jgi:NAD(P)-dependent dehydrogenase (short-subunit alcohol dehydrogenase family)
MNQRLYYIAGDVSQENICTSLIQAAVKRFGRLDVLVNNAGISGDSKKISEISTSDWDYVIDVNLKGAFLCTREALNHMLHDSDIAGTHAKNNYSFYLDKEDRGYQDNSILAIKFLWFLYTSDLIYV